MEIQKTKVRLTLDKIKHGKAAGPSEVAVELVKSLGEEEVQWTTDLLLRTDSVG